MTVDHSYLLTWKDSLTLTGTHRDLTGVHVHTKTAASDNPTAISGSTWSSTINGLVLGENEVTIAGVDSEGAAVELKRIIYRYQVPPASPDIQVVAHRGSSEMAPENTLVSIELAWQQGADVVEIDARLSADKRVMIIHDPTTERTAGSHMVVETSHSDRLRDLTVGRFRSAGNPGEKIPFLEEVIDSIPPGKKLLIEMKTEQGMVPVLQRIFVQSGKLSQLMVHSFDTSQLIELKKALPQVTTLVITDQPTSQQFSADLDGLNVPSPYVNEATVKKAKERGLLLYSWILDDPVLALEMRSLGVSGILTNVPGRIRKTFLLESGTI